MEYDIEKFAERNFNHFSPEEKKTNKIVVLWLGLTFFCGIAIYLYIQNNKKEKQIIDKTVEFTRVQSELRRIKNDSKDALSP